MAINSLDAALAGVKTPQLISKIGSTMEAAGVLHSLFYSSGLPGVAAAPTPGAAGTALTSYAGQIPFTNPVGGETRLMRLVGAATQPGAILLCDRIWHNSGISVTTTTSQAVSSVAFPARDRNASVNGEDVLIGIEVSSATTNGTAVTNTTMSYTDSDSNAGNSGTIASFPATAQAGTFVPFQLAAGDKGVKSVESITLGTSYGGGTIHLVAYRVLAVLPIVNANTPSDLDIISSGAPRLFDNTVPFLLFLPTSTAAVTVTGQLILTQG